MTRNPLINAFAALVYIVAVASFLFYGTRLSGLPDNSVIIPIAMLSLFTLSVAMMGYIFFYYPLRLYLDGDKQVATNLFLHTLGIFATVTALILVALFIGSFVGRYYI